MIAFLLWLLIWLILWLAPLALLSWIACYLVSLPLRRQERARFFLDLLEHGLKEGRTPELWKEFQNLLKLSPHNRLLVELPDQTKQTFRWVNDLEHIDQDQRRHVVHALLCEEENPQGKQTFAWLTDLRLEQTNVCAVANQAGRTRSNIENQGFNIQKNSGLNLEHAYSTDPDILKSFYYLLQIAHLFLQMFERGSLLQRLAQDHKTTPLGLFGSLKNMAKRLLECLRYFELPNDAFETGPGQIRLCDSA